MFKRLRARLTFFHWILLVSVLSALGAAGVIWGLTKLWAREFPDVARLKKEYPVVLYQGPKKPFRVKLQKTPPPGWANYGEISRYAIGAVIVSEDASFFQHEGYDPEGIKHAIKEDLAKGKFVRGGSTIPMQVVKNVFLSQEKSIYRKAREFLLAIRLDEEVPKRRILEVYFNIAEFGEGLFGIRRASSFYFQKSPSELSPKEAAFLAMLLPSPKRYSQSFRSKQLTRYAARTIDKTLERMAKGKFMPEEMLEGAKSTPLSFEIVSSEAPPDEPAEEEPTEEEASTPHLIEETVPETELPSVLPE